MFAKFIILLMSKTKVIYMSVFCKQGFGENRKDKNLHMKKLGIILGKIY